MTQKHRSIKPYPPHAHQPRHPSASDRGRTGWEIAIFGDLTDKQSEIFEHLLEVPRNTRGTIFFDSGGGSVYVGLALASLIRLRGLKAAGVVVSECSSAALLPLAACETRYVTSHATLLFHPMRWQSEEDVRLEEAAEWARHFKVLEEDLDQLLARMFNLPLTRIREWTHPCRFVGGAELVEAGVAKLIDLFSGDVWSQMEQLSAREKPNA